MGQLDPMNKIAQKYQGKMTFLFIYAREAHPESATALFPGEEDSSAVTEQKAVEVYAERQKAGRSLRTRLAENWHVLIDNYGQQGARLSCGLDNPLFVIGADGKVAKLMEWTDAEELEFFLKTYLANQLKKRKS
jgi:hypothetical protein